MNGTQEEAKKILTLNRYMIYYTSHVVYGHFLYRVVAQIQLKRGDRSLLSSASMILGCSPRERPFLMTFPGVAQKRARAM